MHTALVSRILRDKTLWEEVTFPDEDRSSMHLQRRGRRRIFSVILEIRFVIPTAAGANATA